MMSWKLFRNVCVALGLSFLICVPEIGAWDDYKVFTEVEIRSLPFLIEAKLRFHLGDKRREIREVVDENIRKYGWGYNTLHHYGKGLIYLNRVKLGIMREKKDFLLKIAINEFSFSLDPEKIKTFSKEFIKVFLPAMYYKRGETLLLQGEAVKAIADFESSIKIEPSNYVAYVMLSECYKRLGRLTEAEKILQLGQERSRNK